MKKLLLVSTLLFGAALGFAQDNTDARFHNPGGHGGGGGYQGNHYSPPVMSHHEYMRALDAIRRRSFDDDRLVVAQQIARGGMLSSSQVSGIVDLFSFESTRLSFAKFAYSHVVDPFNYYVVNDAFRFSSSIDALASHMNAVGMSGHVVMTQGSYGINHGATPAPACGNTVTYSTGTMTASGGISGGGNVGVNGYYGAPAPMVIHESDFQMILNTVDNRSFDSDRLTVAKQALNGRFVSAGMVLRVMELFSFDHYRLDFAKFAYGQCIDKHNYYLVNDGFSFSSSTRELDAYIQNFR